MNWRVAGLAVAIVVALAASFVLRVRGEAGPGLVQELAELSKDLRGRVDPLPQLRPVPPAAYRAGNLPDPFNPGE